MGQRRQCLFLKKDSISIHNSGSIAGIEVVVPPGQHLSEPCHYGMRKRLKFILKHAMNSQRRSRVIALLLL